MPQLHPYLAFDGNCREAMEFYQQALGAELTLQKVGETPAKDGMPPETHDSVMHSSLEKNGQVLVMASDMMSEETAKHGNDVSLCYSGETEEETRAAFKNLSEGGKVTSELKLEFWGDLYGDLYDKYGFRWMFNYGKSQDK